MPAETYVERLLGKFAAASIARAKDREGLRSELFADWEHYKNTGLHLDDDEVDGWVALLEDGEVAELLELHP